MGELDNGGSDLPLSPEELDTYRLIAAGDELPPGRAVDRLTDLGLVDSDPYEPGRYIAHDPRATAQSLRATALTDLSRTVERMAHISVLDTLADAFDPHRLYGGPGSEFLPGRQQMNARIGEVTAQASEEIYTAQPGEPADRDPEILALGIQRTRAALDRGVRVRSLYNTVAHEHRQTRTYVDQIVDGGADVRALGGHFPRMVLIDRRHLFIDNHVIEGAEGNSGWHVFDRSAVMWARSVFLLCWDHATRWKDLDQAGRGIATTER
jgi:hypothetical protein